MREVTDQKTGKSQTAREQEQEQITESIMIQRALKEENPNSMRKDTDMKPQVKGNEELTDTQMKTSQERGFRSAKSLAQDGKEGLVDYTAA